MQVKTIVSGLSIAFALTACAAEAPTPPPTHAATRGATSTRKVLQASTTTPLLQGQALLAPGEPLPKARVSAFVLGAKSAFATTVADAQGRYTLPMAAARGAWVKVVATLCGETLATVVSVPPGAQACPAPVVAPLDRATTLAYEALAPQLELLGYFWPTAEQSRQIGQAVAMMNYGAAMAVSDHPDAAWTTHVPVALNAQGKGGLATADQIAITVSDSAFASLFVNATSTLDVVLRSVAQRCALVQDALVKLPNGGLNFGGAAGGGQSGNVPATPVPAGTLLKTVHISPAGTGIRGLTSDSQGDIWLSRDDKKLQEIPAGASTASGTISVGAGVGALTADKSGNIWAASPDMLTVYVLKKGASTPVQVGSANFSTPVNLVADSSGNVWITDTGNVDIAKVPVGTFAQAATTYSTTNQPNYVAADTSGNLWFSAQDSSNHVRLEALSMTNRTITTNILTGFDVGTGTNPITTDPSGNVWILDAPNPSGTAGTVHELVKGQSTLDSHTYTVGHSPSAIAADPSGNIWVVNQDDNTVSVIRKGASTVSGPYGVGLSSATAGNGSLQYLAIDPSGNVWVSDMNNSCVYEIAP